MAALATAITNVFEPEISSAYFLEEAVAKSKLNQSGIMGTDTMVADAVSKGGRTITMPFWDDLAHNSGANTISDVATDTDDVTTPTGMTSDSDIAVKHFRTKSWQVSKIVKYAAGEDPAKIIPLRAANWWAREKQRLALANLTGIFGITAFANSHSKDIAGEVETTNAANLIGSGVIEDARFLLGDRFEDLTGMMVHSVQLKRLRALGLIDNVPVNAQNPLAGTKPQYMGLDVIVDDGLTTVAGSTSGTKYHGFLFGPGAIAYQDIPLEDGDMNLVLVDEPLKGKGAGSLTLVSRMQFVMHPRGVKYSGSVSSVVSPSDADLANASNWTQVFQDKNIRIARIVTNG